MADRYTITNNVIKDYDVFVIEQRVNSPGTDIISFRDWVATKLIEAKKKQQPKTQPNKIRFLEFVYLQETEYSNLITNYGLDIIKDVIQRLNDYIGSKGDKYKSHYHTILIRLEKKGVKKISENNIPVKEEIEQRKEYIEPTAEEKEIIKQKLLEFKQKLSGR